LIPNLSGTFYNAIISSRDAEVRRHIIMGKIQNVDKEMELLGQKHNSEKNKLQINLLEIKKHIKSSEKEKKNFKNLFKSFAKEQRIYYFDILKKGIDVR
jgi:3-methyladenine DNA glycosylase AlkD